MLVLALALGLLADACPMKIGIARDGAVYLNRMRGWYRTSPKILTDVLRAGCYNDNNPSSVTSVTLQIAPNAPKEKVDGVLSIVERAGWPKSRVTVGTWVNAPHAPR